MPPSKAELQSLLNAVYSDCHKAELVDPDPLLVVRGYPELADRELVALFCASLALGRAASIVVSCRRALAPFGPHPHAALSSMPFPLVLSRLSGFKYRFFDRYDAASLLFGAASLSRAYGGLEKAFASSSDADSRYVEDPASALLLSRCDSFVDRLRASAREAFASLDPLKEPELASRSAGRGLSRNLLSSPRDGSACKRLMLFLRWMIRHDAVDPGGWNVSSPASLVLPLDVHLHRISRRLGMTRRNAADLRAALEITAALRSFDPVDPIRFDFSLSRLGIRSDYSLENFYHA